MGNRKQGIFEAYYEQVQQILLRKIREGRKGKEIELPHIAPELLEVFTKQFQRITIRTLIFEMEICEEEGKLAGETIQDRYDCFTEVFLKDPDYRKEIYEAYPVLHENITQTLEDFSRNINELLDRFAGDRKEINRRLYPGNPCREILQIGGGSSDSHRHGCRVFILELDNGERLVYKPRSMAVEEAYEAFLKWVFENTGMSCWWYRTWDRGEYGWCQWVSSEPCASRKELKRYYYRNGILLCISYLLGSEDMHYENLIAHGEYPVIVDLEMAVGSRGARTKEGLTYMERFYQESVLQTGLLPLYTWNEEGEGVNVGAVNGQGGQLIPVVMPVVVNPGTVKMHMEYQRPRMGEGKNLAMLHGEFVEPGEFLAEIQEGFEKAYSFLTGHQKKTMEMLGLFQNVQVRYLVRDTQQYSMLLMTLGHPDLLVRNPDRQPVWDVLEKGMEHERAAEWLQEQEKQELLRGDVPYFYLNVCKRDLYSGTGETWKDYLDCTAMECVYNRLKHMSTKNMECQKKLIRQALLIGTKKLVGQGLGGTERKGSLHPKAGLKSRGIKAAEKFADLLMEEAVWSEDGKEAGWISIMMAGYREKSYLIRPMNCYLYGGLAGAAVFMAELADKTKKEKYQDLKNVLVRQLFRHTDDLLQKKTSGKRPTGAYSGEASVASAYMLLYQVSKNQRFLTYLRKQCRGVAKLLTEDREYDILGGNAGAVLVFLNAYRLTGEEQYLKWAREAGDTLLQSAAVYEYGMGWINESLGAALTGFAHGTAGIMLALVRLGHDTQEERYLEAAYQAYRYEEHYYREAIQDWEDLRYESGAAPESRGMAWCHGWGGIVMARLAAAKYARGSFQEELVKTAAFARKKAEQLSYGRKVIPEGKVIPETSLCLCHGMCGNLALLWGIGEEEKAMLMQDSILETICREETDLRKILELQECDNYGLFGGISGIGYSCLCGPEKVLELLYMDQCC